MFNLFFKYLEPNDEEKQSLFGTSWFGHSHIKLNQEARVLAMLFMMHIWEDEYED